MLSRFHQNSVMHGCINYFCLACESSLQTDQDVISHINNLVHTKNLAKTNYVESCRQDCIRKVNKRYYCECCNMLLVNMIQINLHIKQVEHEFNKTSEMPVNIKQHIKCFMQLKFSIREHIKWVKNTVIAFDDFLINENAWNGLIENTCLLCGDECEDVKIHKSGALHNLKLVLSEFEVGPDFSMYRRIDESSYQCLTCNSLFSPKENKTHFEKSEHIKLYSECRKAKRILDSVHTELSNPQNDEKTEDEVFVITPFNAKSEKDVTYIPVQSKDYVPLFGGNDEEVRDWCIDRSHDKHLVNGEYHQTHSNERTDQIKNTKYEAKQNVAMATNGVATEEQVESSYENEIPNQFEDYVQYVIEFEMEIVSSDDNSDEEVVII